MIKKISILSLTLVFLVSVTSLPVSLYYCNMADTYSFHNCGMEMYNGNLNSSSSHNNSENIQSQDCCTVKVIDSKVKDNYIPNISENINHVQFIAVVETKDISGNLYFSNKITSNYIDTSPPKFGGSPLYLTNSIFLI